MIKLLFNNVGQGDSILLTWKDNGKDCYGIVDCHIHDNSNPILEEIKRRQITEIEFIIVSHLHHDHYSGVAEVLEHCIQEAIVIKQFLHTFITDFLHILNIIGQSQKYQNASERFFEVFDEAQKKFIIEDFNNITHKSVQIPLYQSVKLTFLAPNGRDYLFLSRQRYNYEAKKSTTKPNLNAVATIIKISNSTESILLTSDATIDAFKRITGVLKTNYRLVQVPHHGSINNLHKPFWQNLKKITDCPAIFSVGEVKRDKLPNLAVVEFFDKEGFFNQSTNFVYGIAQKYKHYKTPVTTRPSSYVSNFSKLKGSTYKLVTSGRFSGPQVFSVPL